MTDDERKVIEFMVKDVRKHQATHKDELDTPSFDDAYFTGKDRGEPDYKQAIELARSYCTFYSNPEVREVRRLSQKFVDLCLIKPHIAKMLSDTTIPDFVLNIRRALMGLVYSQKIQRTAKGKNGEEKTYQEVIYTDSNGAVLENYTPGMWQIVYDESLFNNIDNYYKLFYDHFLWVKMSKAAIENNAKSLIGPLTAHIRLFELAIRIDAQYPFAQVVNDERAIVVGLECDFENDDIKIILAEPGGKLSYISSHNLSDVAMVGEDQITKEPIDEKRVAEDFGISLNNLLPEKKTEAPEVVPYTTADMPTTTKGQFKGFNRPDDNDAPSESAVEEPQEAEPHETFGTLDADSVSFSGDMGFDVDFGANYNNSSASASFSFEEEEEDFNEDEGDNKDDFSDVDGTYEDEEFD